ncbi:MAG TPA: type I polyketide synthase [Mycobacteriales bacterium]|jgi:enediyne polyketide synthase|nr:type I polyketide synthase [Mycobacteriales bacterium]
MNARIAVVGMACLYPDAKGPIQLWENVLAGRRAFRRIPDERMRLADYWSADPAAPDRFYTQQAAVIEGYEFDRVGYRIAGDTYRSTDLTHWLALDVAAQALDDAGFPEGAGLPKASTGVVVGNSLTGEFSRAGLMRLRWPYVRRVVVSALREQWLDGDALASFLATLETRYKSPFPPTTPDSLAGGLSNVIAGRICNHFDFGGGGYTVDGACSSSLLSLITACRGLASGELDAAVAGGVDLSIDPFEVIGFAKTGALATDEMRVYDRGSNGFWPGEGCGMVVLMREEDAVAQQRPVYAFIAGWGISSDGRGGITRPEVAGHRLALERAYRRAGFGIETVGYFEGHGTGTAVGDATELRALSQARSAAGSAGPPAAIGTIKGNIGHTKAAAGVAGALKAILAVQHRVIPPATGHVEPHPELLGESPALRVPGNAEDWPGDRPVRAGVSSMGFGGINAHVVLEGSAVERSRGPSPTAMPARRLVASRQDAELLLLDASDIGELIERLGRLAEAVPRLAYAELTDLAVALRNDLAGRPVRAAVVCERPEQAGRRLSALIEHLDAGARSIVDPVGGVFLGRAGSRPRIGYLFPGQGSGSGGDGGALRQRFDTVDELYRAADLPAGADQIATAIAQPRIVTASVAGLRVLDRLGIAADVAVGHSLGELTALYWAGALDERTLLRIAATRGRVMADASHGGGTMASIAASPETVEPLLNGEPVVIAGYNGPRQTVVSGPVGAVERVREAAGRAGLGTLPVAVSHAFHSSLVEPAARGLAEFLSGQPFRPLTRCVISTVTGSELAPDTDLRALLRSQILAPVQFSGAVAAATDGVDLFIEVGPGRVLAGLAAEIAPAVPVVAIDAGGPSLGGLLSAAAAAYVLGAPVRHEALFGDRFSRPLRLDVPPRFFANPCEAAPEIELPAVSETPVADAALPEPHESPSAPQGSLELLLTLISDCAELPRSAVGRDIRPLDELHLSSIKISEIMNEAARSLGLPPPAITSGFATATLAELAQTLDGLVDTALPGDAEAHAVPAGLADWVRPFQLAWREEPRPDPLVAPAPGRWRVFGAHPAAAAVRDALARSASDGVLLCLPRNCGEESVGAMLDAAHAALSSSQPIRFVVVQHGRGAAALAKALHLEAPRIATCVIDVAVPDDPPAELLDAIVAEVAATAGFSEVALDTAGRRWIPTLQALPRPAGAPADIPLSEHDVVLVTGGGKGITAECALELARVSGARLGLLGRSDPATDAELSANLERMTAAGVRLTYLRVDVAAPAQVRAAVAKLTAEYGPVTVVLHGAGRNEPCPLADVDEAGFRATLAPKVAGLRAVLSAVDMSRLRLLVSFGSIIGRAGLRGEADYAVANDWLTELTLDVGRRHPACRCLALEWSVWSGTGMGDRLDVVEALTREGITPVTTQLGTQALRHILADPQLHGALVVAGRLRDIPTLRHEWGELPLLRFVEAPRVYYPGIELVADAELTPTGDPYLDDHVLDGSALFPAVIGMEAMAQAAGAVSGRTDTPTLTDVEFLRPVVLPVGGSTIIRVAALAVDDETVDVAIRAAETGFHADHFRARLRYGIARPDAAPVEAGELPAVPVEPSRDLYGGILFQGKRFQRLRGYLALAARRCEAVVSLEQAEPWFGTFLPRDTLLGDAGARDAVMHAIQCCIPDETLLPVGIERLYPGVSMSDAEVSVRAVERAHDGDTFTYDVDVRDKCGTVVERWVGLRLRSVARRSVGGEWVPALLGPYLERRLPEVAGCEALAVVVEPDPTHGQRPSSRREQTALALSRALGRRVSPRYRPDGRPEVDGVQVSSSHGAGLTLGVTGTGVVGCDVQPVSRPDEADWAGLLGDRRGLAELVAEETGEHPDLASTRVWSMLECVRKSGRSVLGQGTLERGSDDGWVVFALGELRVATFAASLRGAGEADGPVVFAVLAERRG